ncbi:YdbL family protein [Pseudoxanthomonas wuyuanensis]|uniref:Uncharacterized conserved protein YdbL, DUF1318 family n=1 Tax=Pseudoxanthomonas wuyuanensis TaxID=1073196 RepID=A0A286CVF7_9GAMM|nr:YdbL family protein [Pseudoxanthomonas wuyuanensis]KAF1721315.1 DUF1318 domain-containing protein [Pseudoxanthomonas wuyuanensis]SOD50412.1 Uncharacterized conserved protein YdbL, DUF1318 family [Pseudoxanthomonas wuyuanensis]
MHRWIGTTFAAALLSACVTINVYFPAAEAKEAAREFVEKVIGDEAAPAAQPAPEPPRPGGGSASLMPQRDVGFDWLALVGIGSAHAQSTSGQGSADINIKTPAIQAIQNRMADRFRNQLQAGFDAGALGLTRDGMVEVRDASKLALKDRVATTQAVADDNRDRRAVYKEIAVANGHPEWEDQIRSTFAQQWIASARSGWWYQDAGGSWKQK